MAAKLRSDVEVILNRSSELVDGQNDEAIKLIRQISAVVIKIFKNKLLDQNVRNKKRRPENNKFIRKELDDIKDVLNKFTHWNNNKVQELSISTLMTFIQREAEYFYNPSTNKQSFPVISFNNLIDELVTDENDMKNAVNNFKEYVEFEDVKFHLLKSLNSILKRHKKTSLGNQFFIQNFFNLLEIIRLDVVDEETEEKPHLIFCNAENEENQFKIDYVAAKRLFSSAWMEYLRLQVTPSIYKRILIILHEQVFPHLENPLLLTDFLIDSFNAGGVVSLLSLTSLFFLIKNYNLEYPDFYKRFYSLLTPDIFQAKYRGRFFYLTDLFLSSTYVPEYLLAAFVKRLSRLTLYSSPNVLTVIIPFIRNIVIRHKNLEKLVHNQDGVDVESDPYIMDEFDPAKSRALESSLWELKTLQSHYNAEIAIEAQWVNRLLPQMENSKLSDKYETTITDLFDNETETDWQEVAVSFEKPDGLIRKNTNKIQHFCL